MKAMALITRLDMLGVFAYEFAGAEVEDSLSAEDRLLIARAVRIEFLQALDEVVVDVGESDCGVDVDLRIELVGLDMLGDISLESLTEGGDVLLLHGEAYGIRVTAEIFEQIAGGIDGGVNVEAL